MKEQKKQKAGASFVTTKPSESEKLKFHLPIVSQLLESPLPPPPPFVLFSANELLNSVRPVGAHTPLPPAPLSPAPPPTSCSAVQLFSHVPP